jgi:alpha-1,2-mannosyltransferase
MKSARLVTLIRDRLIYVKVVTAALWLTWLVSIGLSGFRRDIQGKPIGTDHIAFYSAAKLIDEGRGDRIYDNSFMETYQPALLGQKERFIDAYRNPPFYALLYVPTARLPYLGSFWIWTALGLALLWLGLGWLGTRKRLSAFVLALSFYPVFAVFSFGQNSLLSFGAFSLCFFLMERRRLFLAGMASGLLLFKPQLLMGLGLWWLLGVRRYWPCWLGLAATGLILLAVSYAVVPAETDLFIRKLPEIARYDAFHFYNLHNPKAFFTLWTYDDKKAGNLLGLEFLLAASAGFVLFWRRHRDNLPIMFAAAVFLTLWASPHTMIYEWTLVLIPAVLLWDRVPERRDDWRVIFAVAWIVLFVSTPLAKFLFEWTMFPETGAGWAVQLSVPVMGVLGVWAARVLGRREQVEG